MDEFLIGAWTRSRLVVDGNRCVDHCQVLWLQTSVWYADIRLPCRAGSMSEAGPEALFARPGAGAGQASWTPPVMTWHHHLDSLESISDSNPLDRQGDRVVEAGSFRWAGLTIPFREEWHRVSQPEDEISVQADTNRIQVTIGRWRVQVEDHRPTGLFRAIKQDFEEGGWHTRGTIIEPARQPTCPSIWP
jgi:hypothetical protein